MYLLDSGYDWDYLVEPQEKGNSFLRHARAKVLGRLLVAQLVHRLLDAARGPRRVGGDGLHGLERGRVLAAHHAPGDQRRARRPPRAQRPGQHPHRPARGPVRRGRPRGGRPGGPADVAVQRGAHGDQRRGLVPDQLGRRQHADVVVARLSASDHRQPARTSTIRTHCWASRVVLDDQRRAIGRRVPVRPTSLTHAIGRRRGARSSSAPARSTRPSCSMLSGIGPGEHLQRVRRSTSLVDSPGVGANLDDHVEGIVQWDARQADGPHLDAVVGDRPVLDLAARPRPARPDDALRLGALRHEHHALGLPDDRERLLPDAERLPRALARHRAPALARLPRPRARGPALLHRPRGPRRAGDALRRQARAQDRLAAGDGRVGDARAGAGARRASATTSSSTTSTRPTTPSTTRPARRTWAPTPTARRSSTRACASAASRGCAWPTARSCRSCRPSTRA